MAKKTPAPPDEIVTLPNPDIEGQLARAARDYMLARKAALHAGLGDDPVTVDPAIVTALLFAARLEGIEEAIVYSLLPDEPEAPPTPPAGGRGKTH